MTEEFQANNPAQVKKRQQKAERIADHQLVDLRKLLELIEFRRYIWRHMNETCGMLRDPFSSNGSTMTLNIGMQSVARALWAEIERADPAVIPRMMVEYQESLKA